MKAHAEIFEITTRGKGTYEITDTVAAIVRKSGVAAGIVTVLLQHTSAGLTLNENASPDVRRDMRTWFDTVVPEQFPWTHTLEGADDMPAHVKASLTGPELTLPIQDGRLALGTWQGIYLCEHRDHGGARRVLATLSGEA